MLSVIIDVASSCSLQSVNHLGFSSSAFIMDYHLKGRRIVTSKGLVVHMCVGSTNESQHRLSMWQHVLGACIQHSHEMEV